MTTITATKKITMATVKSFVKSNRENLLIKVKSSFDGMTDCVESREGAEFENASRDTDHTDSTLGVNGAWFVGGSRDYFRFFENDQLIGINVSNSCGSFILAVAKNPSTRPAPVKVDQQFIDLYTDAAGNCYSDADPGL